MGVQGLVNIVVAIVILVVTTHLYRVDSAFGGGRFKLPSGIRVADNAVGGLCSTATIMHSGYKCQEHHVVTGDGYIISMSRFPEGRNGESNKQPVLLQHGLIVDGMTWMLNSANESLAFILADNGYDVWIANTRGTRFSRRHVSLDPSDKGTLLALAAFSEGKQVDKVKSAALLSPIAYVSHITTQLGKIAAKAFVGEITDLLGIAEFNPTGEPVVSIFLKALCANPDVDCYDLITELTGPNCCLNISTVDTFLKNEPQSTATKNLVHLAQTIRYGKLAKFNYGNFWSNMKHYGQATPPIYNLNNIPKSLPLFLSYGGKDALSDVTDVHNLLDSLKSHDTDKLDVQFIDNFAHADFIIGVTANERVYSQMMAFFRNHQ